MKQDLKTKVATALSVVYTKCKSEKAFSLSAVISMLNITSSFGTIIKRTGVIERVGAYEENATAVYKWKKQEPCEALAAEVYASLKEYQQVNNQNTKAKAAKLNGPAVQLDLPGSFQTDGIKDVTPHVVEEIPLDGRMLSVKELLLPNVHPYPHNHGPFFTADAFGNAIPNYPPGQYPVALNAEIMGVINAMAAKIDYLYSQLKN
ncbi:hypothetical protein [Foetidibacter luteolus]|uniref:hypothetical protein n=1 Tax=Foetidibacter luteolus TaxID=2608880 RepID=UPI00129AB1BD|nr:hypothetical protein [Foetidibacter luteolus]